MTVCEILEIMIILTPTHCIYVEEIKLDNGDGGVIIIH